MSTTPPPPGGEPPMGAPGGVPPQTPPAGGVPPQTPPPGGAYPPPPPAQPGYQPQPPTGYPQQQPGGYPPQGSPPQAGSGVPPNVAALLAYLFGWVGGLVFYFIEKTNLEVRFHAAQSVLLSIALFLIYIVLNIFDNFVPLLWALTMLWGLVWFGVTIYMCIQGYNLKHVKLPVIGDMAEQWASKPV